MAEEIKEEVVVEEPKEEKKGLFQKAKDAILPDADEQAAIISTFVRITVLAWSGGILTLNYVAIPGVPQQKIDPTQNLYRSKCIIPVHEEFRVREDTVSWHKIESSLPNNGTNDTSYNKTFNTTHPPLG